MYENDIETSGFKIADSAIINDIEQEFCKKYKSVPSFFDWSSKLPNDTPELIFKKSLISEVKNQFMCGCCWAISVSTAMSDCFVIKELVNWSPKISYTYAMMRFPQNKCVGGSSRILLEELKKSKEGLASEYCIDESWCTNNAFCKFGNVEQHFNYDKKEYLSSIVPQIGCYDGTKKRYTYKVDDVYSLTTNQIGKAFQVQTLIKKHIMTRGSVIGGFLIMKNFPSGEFCKTNGGIYFEEKNFQVDDIEFNDEDGGSIIGSHSVVVVGWGVSHNILFDDKLTSVPYWKCRNSWGTSWGEGGYFKIAMFPFNKICQFTKRIRVVHNKQIKEVGGIIGFNVVEKPDIVYLASSKEAANQHTLLKPKELYSIDETLLFSPDFKFFKSAEYPVALIFAVCLISLGVFLKNGI